MWRITMKYNFDQLIDRKGTDCLKFDFAKERGVPEDALSLWVADMDFPTSNVITDRIHEMAAHGIFGYTDAKSDYYEAVQNWYDGHFGWKPERRWIIKTPGVVFALAMAVRAFTEPGDAVLIQQPVYYPFSEVIRDNNRRLVNSPLVYKDRAYSIDLEAFEKTIVREGVKLFLLCSPHNPVGRVWTEEELRGMEEICLRHDVIVVSDEIHSDFVWEGHTHHMLASLDERYQENTIICTAPSKTFNIASMQVSNIFIPNTDVRRAFRREISAAGYSQLNAFGIECCKAAYTGGQEWLDQVKAYIWDNMQFAKEFVETQIPGVHMIMPEGTYLIWLDLRDLKLEPRVQQDMILNKAKLWLDSGAIFGDDGQGFERINAACPRATLEEALCRIRDAVKAL